MNCVLFAKMDHSFQLKKQNFKKYWKNGNKYWKSHGFLSVRKSGNHERMKSGTKLIWKMETLYKNYIVGKGKKI